MWILATIYKLWYMVVTSVANQMHHLINMDNACKSYMHIICNYVAAPDCSSDFWLLGHNYHNYIEHAPVQVLCT